MKKIAAIVLTIIMVAGFCACSAEETKIGISPYIMSEKEKDLLSFLGLENDVWLINFKAPENAQSLDVRVWILENGEWVSSGGGAVSEWDKDDPEGVLSILIKENFASELNITMKGRAAFKTEGFENQINIASTAVGFLTEFRQIEINGEIPVAIMICSNSTKMKNYSVDSYFTPSEFEETELVQVVTMRFSDGL